MFEPSQLEAVFTTDEQGCIDSWSREAQEVFGLGADAAIGKLFDSLLAGHEEGGVPFSSTPYAADTSSRVKSFRRAEGATFRAVLWWAHILSDRCLDPHHGDGLSRL